MPESLFYAKAMRGGPRLVGHWMLVGQSDPDRLAQILADTARLANLGEPQDTPNGATLREWSSDTQPPQWAMRSALFLLVQIPSQPVPHDELEACAWAYCWLRNRSFETFEQAREALPEHLREPLTPALEQAWADLQSQRLI
ncbi:hypothetical protein MHM84_18300 [Halomonas sp. McH1-25]|uniref:hypothetical protein n=1 Tax=unclassified Halomonas TaxID=2609666 RepID=UPI001EF45F0C|nr:MULTISPECIES: hypothetical protein [unclassified Halomonas]MCG7601722.1 hypothetical protein [Halomonas sp. McH1-25]MCP1344571.1 hypothetical protein [Halomonas sp. FL8]MCP1360699.1 hypothetical protein [Halomonas sp. BBD45]